MSKRVYNSPWKRTEKDRGYQRRLALVRENAWKHPYETRDDDHCIHCGQVGSYIHTRPENR